MNNIKYIKNIDPLNKKEVWLDGDTVDFDLPKNKVDLSSFKIFFDVEIDPVIRYDNDTYLKRFLPRLSQSVIDEIIITNNGTVIQNIKEFGLLYNILNDAIKNEDDIYCDKPDTLNTTVITNANALTVLTDFNDTLVASVINPLKYRFFIKDFIGLISESNKSIIDCDKNNLKISIKLAPKEITYRGVKVTANTVPAVGGVFSENYHYRLSKITANIDIVPDSYPSGGKIVFKDYKHIAGNILTNKNSSLKYKHKGNLSYVLGTFTDVDRKTDTGLQLQFCNVNEAKFGTRFLNTYTALAQISTTFNSFTLNVKNILDRMPPHALNNSIYFKRNGLNIKSSQFILNGQNITPQMDISQIFLTAKEFFNNQMNRVKSLVSFQNDFFVFPVQINITDDEFISEIEWNVESGENNPNGGMPHLFICYDKFVEL